MNGKLHYSNFRPYAGLTRSQIIRPMLCVREVRPLPMSSMSTRRIQPRRPAWRKIHHSRLLQETKISNNPPMFQVSKLSMTRIHTISSYIMNIQNILSFKNVSDSIKGTLTKHLDFWKEIKASAHKIDIIKNECRIPFIHTPDPATLKIICRLQKQVFRLWCCFQIYRIGSDFRGSL